MGAPATATDAERPGSAPAIELIGISKSFGSVQANRDIDLSVARGTIHGQKLMPSPA